MASESESEDGRANIEPLAVKHKCETFTYQWDLEYKGHSIDNRSIAEYIPLKEPLRTKAGKIAARQPQAPQKKPHMWWKAQCIFRGFSSKGTIAQLQDALRGHENDGMVAELRELEKRSRREYRKKNKEAGKVKDEIVRRELDEKWKSGALTVEAKVKLDPKRYLSEVFPEGGNEELTLTLTLWDYHYVQSAARELALLYEYATAPDGKRSEASNFSDRTCLVLGRDPKAVASRVASIKGQTQKRKRENEDYEEEIKRAKRRKIEETLAKCKDWDVTGNWKIDCPYIDKNWNDNSSEGFTLEIYQEQTPKGPQMYGTFNFVAIDGIFRFERQDGEERLPYDVSLDKNDSFDEHNEDEEDGRYGYRSKYNDYEDRDRKSPTPDAFYLGKSAEVSPKHATWNYRWRGHEKGEEVIDVRSTEKVYSITFEGPKGFTLKGTFGAEIMPEFPFTGEKIDVISKKINITEEWADRNERAYDYACHRRWGKWYLLLNLPSSISFVFLFLYLMIYFTLLSICSFSKQI